MASINLHPILRDELDVLFVALNAPEESNENGRHFSGKRSRFFELLFKGGLITERIEKTSGDEIVFRDTRINYEHSSFGIVDIVDDVVETSSKRVKVTRGHVEGLLKCIRDCRPRFVCVIH